LVKLFFDPFLDFCFFQSLVSHAVHDLINGICLSFLYEYGAKPDIVPYQVANIGLHIGVTQVKYESALVGRGTRFQNTAKKYTIIVPINTNSARK